MTRPGPDVAYPGRDRGGAPSTYHDHPGTETRAACPNCRSTEHLELHGTTPTVWRIEAYRVGGVTEAIYDVTEVEVDEPLPTPRRIEKVRCSNCGWSISSHPAPLGLLGEAIGA